MTNRKLRKPGRPKGTPKTGGRQKGTPNKATVEAKAACSDIVDDPLYRANLLKRARQGKLPAAVECLLWHYAKGKPTDHIEHSGSIPVGQRVAASELTDAELAAMKPHSEAILAIYAQAQSRVDAWKSWRPTRV